MIKFIRYILGMVVLAALALFLLTGGWRRLGLSRMRLPSVGAVVSSAGDPRQQALGNALARMGINLSYAQAEGAATRVMLSWAGQDSNRGTLGLNQAQQMRLIRSFQPAGSDYLDRRNEKGQPVYVGRFLVQF